MAYSDNFPATRPVFMADFANGGRIDPRATFSRSDTPPTYAAPSAVHYMSNEKHISSENLVDYSDDISQSSWSKDGVTETGGQTAPDGGSDAYKLTENSASGHHRVYKQIVTGGGAITFSAYFKYIGRQWVRIRLTDSSATDRYVWFDIQNGVAGTAETGFSDLSITASGNGYYKVSATLSTSISGSTSYVVAAGAGADNSSSIYTGSGADSFAVWGIQVSSIGEKVLNETSGSIHRAYAPTLKSVSYAGQPRFEYSATDGESMGILVEGSRTNLVTRSSELDAAFWNTFTTANIDANVAVSIDGTLTADLIRPTTATSGHYVQTNAAVTTVDASTYTLSAYVKAAGLTKTRLYFIRASSPYTTAAYGLFTLTGDGSVEDVQGSATISPVGNGWYRISVTGSAVTTLTTLVVQPTDASGTATFAGDGYSGILCTGVQFELGSHASSLISTSGSAVTRASDSLSVATADIGYTGGPVSLVTEFEAKASITQYVGVLSNTGYGIYTSYANLYQDAADSVRIDVNGSGGASDARGDATVASSAGSRKIAARYENNNYGLCVDGGTVATDTSGTLPVFDKLDVGSYADGGSVNSTIKRIALYSEALSDSNLISLTK